jgi:hypothetical protein
MELQGKLDSFVRVKAELLKRLQLVWSRDITTHPHHRYEASLNINFT